MCNIFIKNKSKYGDLDDMQLFSTSSLMEVQNESSKAEAAMWKTGCQATGMALEEHSCFSEEDLLVYLWRIFFTMIQT